MVEIGVLNIRRAVENVQGFRDQAFELFKTGAGPEPGSRGEQQDDQHKQAFATAQAKE